MLAHARAFVPEAVFLVRRLEDPLPDGPFDLVVSAFAIHHLDADGKSTLFERVAFVFTHIWPVLTGGTEMPLDHYAMRSSAVVGSAIIGWTAGGAMLLMLMRLVWLWRLRRTESSIAFAVYLALVGCSALAGYALTMLAWSWWRLPETLHPEFRRSLAWREMASAVVQTSRPSVGWRPSRIARNSALRCSSRWP